MGSATNAGSGAGITLAFGPSVPSTSNPNSETVVLWRMQRATGLHSHAVIGPRSDGAVIIWFINDRPMGYRDFTDWTSALEWSNQLRQQNWAAGWRPTAE